MKTEEIRACDVCEGLGMFPVTCVSGGNEHPRRYLPTDDAKPCTKCSGKGERIVVVSDERERRDEEWDFREEAWERSDFIEQQRMYR